MKPLVIGIDPSFTSCGVSDGNRHIRIKTFPRDDQNAIENLRRRSLFIATSIVQFIDGRAAADGDELVHIYIEAPMLSAHGNGANHLFEMGWLMNDLYHIVPTDVVGRVEKIEQIPTSTLRKWALGKGNVKKDEMKLKVFRKFGIEFVDDPGADKLFAYLLHRYGAAVAAGEIEAAVPARRGKGAHALAAQRARAS